MKHGHGRCVLVLLSLFAFYARPASNDQRSKDCFGSVRPFCLFQIASSFQIGETAAELAEAKAARERGNSEEALHLVQKILLVNPELIEAHFLLASVADDMCHPNAEPGPDEQLCGLAFQEYAHVVKMDGRYPGALTSLAYLSYQFNKLDEAEENYRAALKVNDEDPEALCGVAGIRLRRVMADLAVATDGGVNQPQRRRFISSHGCIDARSRNYAGIEEGIALVTRDLQIRPGDVDLMSYLAGLHWLRAEIECADQRAYDADMRIATDWDRAGYRSWRAREQKDFLQKCPTAPNPLTFWKRK